MPGLSLVCSLVILLVLRVIRFMIWLLRLVLSLEMFLKRLSFLLNIGYPILSLLLFLSALPCFLLNLSHQIPLLLFPLQNSLLSPQIWLFLLMSSLTLFTLILTPLILLVMFLSLHLLFNMLSSSLELENLIVIFKTIIATWLLHMCRLSFTSSIK